MEMPGMTWDPFFGAVWRGGEAVIRVWAPQSASVELVLEHARKASERFAMEKDSEGCFQVRLKTARPGGLYSFDVDGNGPWPDPASRYQPQGVHGPSQLVDPAEFSWSDAEWEGVSREKLVLYELHVGTFTPEGTFTATVKRLPLLRALGVTAIELMPVADFPGSRNWGYDGVALFAPARCYGAPDDLRRLVDTAHGLGLAVHLDVVYNHLGPDGSYLAAFSPLFFSQKHHSPWGAGINFDGPGSDVVRRIFIENALHWIHEYHVDGLRLDATHAIIDESPKHFLAQLTEAVEASTQGQRRRVLIIAEDHRNLSVMATPRARGGWGLDAIWADDLHHELHRCVTGEGDGYYADFTGNTSDVAATVRQGWFYCGQYAPYFGEERGTDPYGLPPSAFVVCIQNHDQVGNRAFGKRLNHLIDLASYRAVSIVLLLAPEVPLLFMGQEWASSSPFQYFTDHAPKLGQLVTEGRRREFARFAAFSDPAARERIPDPQDPSTFARSRLIWEEAEANPHAGVRRLYQQLLHLRSSEPALKNGSRAGFEVVPLGENGLLLWRQSGADRLLAVIQLRESGTHDLREHSLSRLSPGLAWRQVLTTEDAPFADDPMPPEIELPKGRIQFARPGAVLLRSMPAEGGE
jgi:maltooligosyltrehalose trehalohydrolase